MPVEVPNPLTIPTFRYSLKFLVLELYIFAGSTASFSAQALQPPVAEEHIYHPL